MEFLETVANTRRSLHKALPTQRRSLSKLRGPKGREVRGTGAFTRVYVRLPVCKVRTNMPMWCWQLFPKIPSLTLSLKITICILEIFFAKTNIDTGKRTYASFPYIVTSFYVKMGPG